jgi:hypothetical protein
MFTKAVCDRKESEARKQKTENKGLKTFSGICPPASGIWIGRPCGARFEFSFSPALKVYGIYNT